MRVIVELELPEVNIDDDGHIVENIVAQELEMAMVDCDSDVFFAATVVKVTYNVPEELK